MLIFVGFIVNWKEGFNVKVSKSFVLIFGVDIFKKCFLFSKEIFTDMQIQHFFNCLIFYFFANRLDYLYGKIAILFFFFYYLIYFLLITNPQKTDKWSEYITVSWFVICIQCNAIYCEKIANMSLFSSIADYFHFCFKNSEKSLFQRKTWGLLCTKHLFGFVFF